MPNRRLVQNTLLLTAASLLMQGIGMAYQVWLAGRIGAAGIGLFQLTLSVLNFGATFAISGVRFASTRLIAEELGDGNTRAVGAALRRCLGYAAVFGFAALGLVYYFAEPLGTRWIHDARTVLSLKISAFSLPCFALSSAASGYFTACGRVWKPTLIHLIEQLVSIALVAWLLGMVPPGDLERGCAAVSLGRLGGDLLSLTLMLAACAIDRRRHYPGGDAGRRLTGRLLRIAMPLAVSAYARSALSTLQHLMTPRGLRAAGYSANRALAGYGIVHGMALPVVFFPSCVLGALSELIVPRLTEAQVRKDDGSILDTVYSLLRNSLLFSLTVAGFLYFTAEALGWLIYQNSQAGHYIRILALLIPCMYLDMTVDGCLKGLGQQLWCMGINIADALLSLLMVWQLLPRYALGGYLATIYFTELFNFALSMFRLLRILPSGPRGDRLPGGGSGRCAYTAAASGRRRARL